MSLINEALKRAKEAQGNPAKPAPAPAEKRAEPAMRPVEGPKRSSGSPAVYILSTALVFVLIGAVVLLVMWTRSEPKTVQQSGGPASAALVSTAPTAPVPPAKTESAPAAVVQASAPAVPAATIVETAPAVPAAPPVATVEKVVEAQPAAVAQAEPSPAPEPVAPPKPPFPTLKLQGVFYNTVNPAAVINGKTYFVGNVVSDAKIVKIESDRVTVEWNNETRVLETSN